MWLPFEPDVLWEALQGPWAEGVVRAETLMRARLLSDLGFARKQGRLSLGREKVIARLTKAGENGVLIHAMEASAGELRKLGFYHRRTLSLFGRNLCGIRCHRKTLPSATVLA